MDRGTDSPAAPGSASSAQGAGFAALGSASSAQVAGVPTWWTASSLGAFFGHESTTSEGMYHPNGNNCPENFHFVGSTATQPPNSPIGPSSIRTMSGGSPPVHEVNAKEKETIDVDVDESTEDVRTNKRLPWTKDEDIRLASAWLHNSKDPVDGNDRKLDQYWTAVTEEYNKTTERSRRRNRNQMKIRWDRVKKQVIEFHGCWVRTTKVYRSGMSDDQQMELAEKLYASEHGDKDFKLKHIWKVVRYDRKWSAYVKKIEGEKEKDKGAGTKAAQVVNLEESPSIRPMGHKRAKDERNGKRKAPDAYSAISEKLDKFIEVSTMARKDREKMSEVQQNLANSKVEAAKLNHKAAQEQTKCKMLDIYKELLLAPTSNLSAQALAEREKALDSMRMTLFGQTN